MSDHLCIRILLFFIILFLPAGCRSRTSTYKVLADLGISLSDEVVEERVLSSYTSDLGNSGHRTTRINLTNAGINELLDGLARDNGKNQLQMTDISGFGNTLTKAQASHAYSFEYGSELIFILVDEKNRVAEVVVAW